MYKDTNALYWILLVLNNFHKFRILGNFLICFRKFDWKSDTRHSFLKFVAKSGQNFIKKSQKNARFDADNEKSRKFISHSRKNVDDFWLNFWDLSGAKVCKSWSSKNMLKNEYMVEKIGVDTAENEPPQNRGKMLIISIISVSLRSVRHRRCDPASCWRFEMSDVSRQRKESGFGSQTFCVWLSVAPDCKDDLLVWLSCVTRWLEHSAGMVGRCC